MTNIALIDVRDKQSLPESENLGLAYIGAYLRNNGYDVHLYTVDSSKEGAYNDELEGIGFEADIYGFSLFHTNLCKVFSLTERIKQKNPKALICVGGRFATENANAILTECKALDFIVLGDGEGPLLEAAGLFPHLDQIVCLPFIQGRKTTGQIHKKKELSVTVNIEKTRPVRDFAYSGAGRIGAVAHLYAKRGCTCPCTFCLMNSQSQKKIRKYSPRTAEDIFDEIVSLNHEYGFRAFMFHDCPLDDGGKRGMERIDKLCRFITEFPQSLAFQGMLLGRFSDLTLAEPVQRMRNAGFSQVMLLLGAGSDWDAHLLKRPGDTSEKEKIIQHLKENDMEVMFEFYPFNPLSTLDSMTRNFHFLMRQKAYRLGDFIRKIPLYKGSNLYIDAKEKGLLSSHFSYKTPFAYLFADAYLQELNDFFEETLWASSILKDDAAFQNQIYLYNWMRVLFPDAMAEVGVLIKDLRENLHEVAIKYLTAAMLDGNLGKAREQFKNFEKEMKVLFSGTKSIQLRMLRNKDVRQYLLRG